MKRITLLLLSLLLTATALGGEVLIPAVYRGAGANGTLWRSDIVVSNISSNLTLPTWTTITYYGDDGTTRQVRMPLAPKEVMAVPDAVRAWFDVENGGGIVLVTWDDAPNVRIITRARVYTTGAHGEYGQSVPGVDTWKLVSEQYLPGLSGIDGNRTNVGVSNPTNATTIVWFELIDTSGESRGAFAQAIGPRTFVQLNDVFSYFQAGPLNAAMVRVVSSNAPVYAYASIVRNDSGDATFVMQP
ncbi:MAG TPA: hypothetical protein VND45_15825 [Thermoanaerobaculia bacterium]|jgi:hypothetical protein|nr:hypothetical protein [Thermoanaerobaculia bacterium]